jgi:hypothetical protein
MDPSTVVPGDASRSEPNVEGPLNRTRIGACFSLFVGAILLTVSLFEAWWTFSISSGTGSETVYLLPGPSYTTIGALWSGPFSTSGTYAAGGLVNLGQLYGELLWVGIIVIGAAVLGGVLGLASMRSIRFRVALYVTILLNIGTAIVSVLLPLLIAGTQPTTFASDVGGEMWCSPPPSPCTAFWGSETFPGGTLTWGPGVGWFFALAAMVAFLAAGVLLIASFWTASSDEESEQPRPVDSA